MAFGQKKPKNSKEAVQPSQPDILITRDGEWVIDPGPAWLEKDTVKARKWVDRLLRKDPEHPDALELKAGLLERTHDYGTAAQYYSLLLKNNPDEKRLLFHRATCYFLLDQPALVLRDVNKLIGLDSNSMAYRSFRMVVNTKCGKYDDVFQDIDFMIANGSSYQKLKYRFLKTNALYSVGNYQQAQLMLDTLLKENPFIPAFLDLQAKLSLHDNQYDKAAKALKRLLNGENRFGNAYFTKARLNMALGDKEQACKDFSKAMKLDFFYYDTLRNEDWRRIDSFKCFCNWKPDLRKKYSKTDPFRTMAYLIMWAEWEHRNYRVIY